MIFNEISPFQKNQVLNAGKEFSLNKGTYSSTLGSPMKIISGDYPF